MEQPKTIAELQALCDELGLPLYTLHIVIGQDVNMPKIFGIYQDAETGEFVVYKNKSDGSRAERYRGTDEEYAVGELWAKISEIADRARRPNEPEVPEQPAYVPQPAVDPFMYDSPEPRNHRVNPYAVIRACAIAILIGIMVVVAFLGVYSVANMSSHGSASPRRGGYYDIGSEHYYYQPSRGWYHYDGRTWYPYSMPVEDYGYYDDYYIDDYAYDEYYGFEDWYADEYDYDWSYDDGPLYEDDYYHDYDYGYDYGYQDDYGHEDDYGYQDDYDYGYDDGYDSSWDSDYDWDSDWDSDYDYDSSWDSDWDSSYDWDSDW